ncbi:dTMP kinase [Nonomuraea africana]|uniref:dTMP kinase n=1 Tax=Nonomuraea africana TaxID=46171 RepID=UPI0033D0BCCE
MNKPTWIIFEGIDGSGKTTQAKLLNDYLNRNGVKSSYRHVFDSKAGKLLREMFLGNTFSNTVEILMLCAARQAFLDETRATEDGEEYDVLIVDRFFLSILAMQGNDDADIDLINYIRGSISRGRDRSIVFHMNTSPENCKSRLVNRTIRDRIEGKGVEFHRMVFERYLALLSDEENAYQFDGDADIETVHRTIVDKTMSLLGITPGPGVRADRRVLS